MEYQGEGGIADIRNRIYKRRGQVALDSTGKATIAFVPPVSLPREPFLELQPRIVSGSDKVIANVVDGSFTVNAAGDYTGVTIEAGRVRGSLPTMNTVSGLLSAVITGVNSIVNSLSGLSIVNNTQVDGVKVDWMAF